MTDQESKRGDSTFLMLVGGLLVAIIALLAVLWQKERMRRAEAEMQLQTLAHQSSQQMNLLAQSVFQGQGGPGSAPPAVHREDLPAEMLPFKGKVRTVLTLGASAGERLGFAPGDVIVVAEPVATSRPGGQ